MATQPLPAAGTGDDADTGLDPADWAAFRTLAHRMLDDSLDHIAGRRDQPVWQPMPDAVRAAFDGPLPRAPEGLEAAYDDFRRTVVPYSMGNDHPRFWGWYMGAGNPVGNLADLLASVLNPNMGGADHAPVLVEQQVVRWCAEAAGYPTSASGLLVTGASEANLVGLAVARTVRIGPEVRTDGIPGGRRFGVYASTEVHSCHRKSLELLGLGESSLRLVPVRDDYTMDVDALAAAVAADRAAGIEPLAVIATVGTINTGSVDDLEAIADLAEREGLWLHVDGAIGGFLALSSHPDAVRGLERADSLALDLHKWMQAPIDVGLALVRDEAAHRATFSVVPHYLQHSTRGLAAGEVWFNEYGIALSRGFRALRVWLALKAYGADAFGAGHGPQHRPGPRPGRPGRRPPRPRADGAGRLRRGLPALRPGRGCRPTGSTRSTTSWCCASTRAGSRSSATPCSTGRWRCGSPSATTAPATTTSSCSSTPCSTSAPRSSPTSTAG